MARSSFPKDGRLSRMPTRYRLRLGGQSVMSRSWPNLKLRRRKWMGTQSLENLVFGAGSRAQAVVERLHASLLVPLKVHSHPPLLPLLRLLLHASPPSLRPAYPSRHVSPSNSEKTPLFERSMAQIDPLWRRALCSVSSSMGRRHRSPPSRTWRMLPKK